MSETLIMTRRLKARPETVFRALTEAGLMARWMRPGNGAAAEVSLELRLGGRLRIILFGADGARHPVEGRFVEIAPPHRLAFTWRWAEGDEMAGVETTVRFALEPEAGGTRLTLAHEGLRTAARIESHRGGWSAALAHLETLVETEAETWTA